MNIKTLKEIKSLKGKKILLRVDFNVPINAKNKIQDDSRIKESLPTIKYLIENEAKIIILSHLGRPEGKIVESLKLDLVAKHLGKLLKKRVKKLNDTIGNEVEKEIGKMKNKDIIVLENVRFYPEEEKNDKKFSKELAQLADFYVNDGFGVSHRAHSSTEGITQYLPSFGGFLMEKEIINLSEITEKEAIRPFMMIFGGSKIDTKIGLLKKFINKCDYVFIGGALANTFLAAAGYNIGKSLYEENKIEIAREIMLEFEKNHEKLILPHDVEVVDEISEKAVNINIPIQDVTDKMIIADVGKWTTEEVCLLIKKCGTVVWNGPLGICEYKPFQDATKDIANTIAETNCVSIIGGGDTVDALKKVKANFKKYTHISTGGGACMEFLEGKILPGIKPLLKK